MGWKPYLNVDIANCAFILAKNVMDVLGDGVVKIPGSLAKWSNYEYDEARALLKSKYIVYSFFCIFAIKVYWFCNLM